LIDVRGGPPIEDATVAIRGSTIVAADARRKVVIPSEAQTVDVSRMSFGCCKMHQAFQCIICCHAPVTIRR
jgi:hypothetical protein